MVNIFVEATVAMGRFCTIGAGWNCAADVINTPEHFLIGMEKASAKVTANIQRLSLILTANIFAKEMKNTRSR